MGINNLSFITPATYQNNKLTLSKKYSQFLNLKDKSIISLSSHSGINKKEQQDSLAIVKNKDYLMFLLADGIGGMEHGAEASYQAVSIIKKIFELEDPNYLKDLNKYTLEEFLYTVMYEIILNIPPFSGTTLNLSIICPDKTLIANIGNSRIYTIKDGKLTLQTNDDSLSFEKFKPKTSLERDYLRFYKNNNEITNAIIKDYMPIIHIKTIKNEEYQIICHLTDGITNVLTEREILGYCYDLNPANSLVCHSIYGKNCLNQNPNNNFLSYIERGKDNTTALVYKKIK